MTFREHKLFGRRLCNRLLRPETILRARHQNGRLVPWVRAQPLPELKDLVLWRGGNLLTAQWRGSPKFSVGVLSALNDDQASNKLLSR